MKITLQNFAGMLQLASVASWAILIWNHFPNSNLEVLIIPGIVGAIVAFLINDY